MTLAYRWKKSSRSNEDGACVELAHADHPSAGRGVVRDSKNPNGPILAVDLPTLTEAAKSSRLELH